MRTTKQHYISGITSGLVSYVLGYCATFLAVYFLTQLLTKDEYGTYAFLLALVHLVAIGATLGLNRALLYRVAGETDVKQSHLTGLGYFRHCLKLNALAAVLAMVGFVLCGHQLLAANRFPDLGTWLICIAPVIPALVINPLCNGLFQANHRIVAVQIVPKLRDILLAAGLAGLWLAGLSGPVTVVLVLLVASYGTVVLWLVLVAVASRGDPAGPRDGPGRRMSGEDIAYGAKLMLTEFTKLGMERVDILMLGILATAASTADYALSVKLATLTYITNSLLDPIFTPRMRAALAARQRNSLQHEYDLIRFLTLTTTLCGSIVFLLFGPTMLLVFGDFSGAHHVLITLTSCFLIKGAFGANGRYLNMAGYGNWTLGLTCVLLFMALGLNRIMVPLWAAEGAAWATLVSLLFVNVLTSYIIYHKDNFATLRLAHILILTVSLSSNLLLTLGSISATLAASMQLAVLMFLLRAERSLWLPHIKSMGFHVRTVTLARHVIL